MTISTHVSASRRTGNYTIEDLTGVFQFTSPQGDEQYRLFTTISRVDFNSRLRKKTNFALSLPSISVNVFQLTSPRGDELLSFLI